MPRVGGEREGRHVIRPLTARQQMELNAPEVTPLNPRQRKEVRDTERRVHRANIEEERFRRQHFRDDAHLCPVCRTTCNGFLAKSGRAALCIARPSKSPDAYQLGFWHGLNRACSCGEVHSAAPAQ